MLAAVFTELAVVRMYATIVGGMSYYGKRFYVAAIFFVGCGFAARKIARRQTLVPPLLLVAALVMWWLSHYNMIQTLDGKCQWYSFANVAPKSANFGLQSAVLLLVLAMAPPLGPSGGAGRALPLMGRRRSRLLP